MRYIICEPILLSTVSATAYQKLYGSCTARKFNSLQNAVCNGNVKLLERPNHVYGSDVNYMNFFSRFRLPFILSKGFQASVHLIRNNS